MKFVFKYSMEEMNFEIRRSPFFIKQSHNLNFDCKEEYSDKTIDNYIAFSRRNILFC